MDIDMKSLHPLEVRLLTSVGAESSFTVEQLEQDLGLKPGQGNQAVSWLSVKKYIRDQGRGQDTRYEITDLGKTYAEIGTPAFRIFGYVKTEGAKTLPEIAAGIGVEKSEVGSAYGVLSKAGALVMDAQKRVNTSGADIPNEFSIVGSLLKQAAGRGYLIDAELTDEERSLILSYSKKRGADSTAFRAVTREIVTWALTEEGLEAKAVLEKSGITGDEIGRLTQEMLSDGAWKGRKFRSYNINVPPKRVLVGRKNPYSEYLESVKDKLTTLGFEEYDGPLVETEFWNGDALFMPQFHSARDIHDVYYTKDPTHAREIEQPWLDQVALTHENGWNTGSSGWGYQFDRDFTRRMVLRSQGTVLSAKWLTKAKVPGRYFGVVRCFRYDQIDASHGAEFYQTEGIVLSENVNLRTLLGLLKMFAVEVAGATEFKFVPGYFPFTEPSIEVHIKHPVLGWFELGGSGIFRPEVTKPLGIEVPVLAWGLGIDRMAMMQLGRNDMRDLFSHDLERVRLWRRT